MLLEVLSKINNYQDTAYNIWKYYYYVTDYSTMFTSKLNVEENLRYLCQYNYKKNILKVMHNNT